jgi:hypothetical protein
MEIGTEAAQFLEKEYLNGIFGAVCMGKKYYVQYCKRSFSVQFCNIYCTEKMSFSMQVRNTVQCIAKFLTA